MRTAILLPHHRLTEPGIPESGTVQQELIGGRVDPEVHYWLGAPGACDGRAHLTWFLPDDSGSVAGGGGTDPLSRRYAETRLVVRRLGRACTCGRELAGVAHWDRGPLDVAPHRIHGSGAARLQAGLGDPGNLAGTSIAGSSDPGPVLDRVTAASRRLTWRGWHPHLVIASDFQIIPEGRDQSADAVFARLHQLAGRWQVSALVLGDHVDPRLAGGDVHVIQVRETDPPGQAARALFGLLTAGRPGAHPAVRGRAQ